MDRQRIKPDEEVVVRMTARDKELLLEYTLGDPEYAERLKPVPGSKDVLGKYTLDDLEDMLGYIAAEANHTDDSQLQSELDVLHNKLFKLQRSYDDGSWNDSAL